MPSITQKSQSRIYHTNQIYEASYLLSLGLRFLGSEDSGTNYLSLLFEDSPELQKAVSDFNNNAPVPVLTFVNSYKRAKELIFRGKK